MAKYEYISFSSSQIMPAPSYKTSQTQTMGRNKPGDVWTKLEAQNRLQFPKHLNVMGRSGWELVASSDSSSGRDMWTFKREL